MNSKFKQIAGLLSILILGFALGVLLSPPLMGWLMNRGNPEARIQSLTDQLESQIGLDSEQSKKVYDVLITAQGNIRDLHLSLLPKVREIRGDTRTKIREVLRADQISKFEEVLKNVERRTPLSGPEQGMRRRRMPPPPMGPPPPF